MTPKTSTFARYFVWMCCVCIIFFVIAVLRPGEKTSYKFNISSFAMTAIPLGPPIKPAIVSLAHEDLKYILQWTSSLNSPLRQMGRGRSQFLQNKCEFTNCYVTNDKNYFLYVTDFDVVVFHGKDAFGLSAPLLPKSRSQSQIYIFAMMESSHNYPVCDARWNGFFNWTWTYRLDSDIRLGYLSFYDKVYPHERRGPKADMDWSGIDSRSGVELPQEDLDKLKSKTKAAAWFVSNCASISKREDVVRKLKEELTTYNLDVDVYGSCGELKCPRKMKDQCNQMLESDYYFYLSFENSFAEDYVTEKLYTALEHLTVPVVYGGANYCR